ncbi:MAG: asparagine synthase (glutamine-hydrolyzing) [Bacteroidia bacterium]
MCGIAGVIKLKNSSLNLSTSIVQMTDAISHRGPDDEGFFLAGENSFATAYGDHTAEEVKYTSSDFSPSEHIRELRTEAFLAFGHRRLSIIDLTAGGHQPMCVKEKQLWITYNGEIYNYIELREELILKGYRFLTGSDTEVILNSYREWGEDCLSKFNGMWAFVIYDREKHTLFGSRDRFGVKPFYYYRDEKMFAFASEQKALLKAEGIKTGINSAAAFDFFLKNTMEHEEEGMFKNILELFPSFAFRLDLKQCSFVQWKYYTLPLNTVWENFSGTEFNEAVSKTRALFLNAISLRLRSDVPVGSCLSGGIDSSAIVSAIHELRKNSIPRIEKLHLFTASFSEPEIDESAYAELVADQVHGEWHKIKPDSAQLLKDFEAFTYCQDLPIWSTSGYAQYRVMAEAKAKGIKVVLDGQGGDELFAGYYPYHFRYWMDLLKRGQPGNFYAETRAFSSSLSFMVSQGLRQYGTQLIPTGLLPMVYKSHFHDIRYLRPAFWETYKKRLVHEEQKPSSLNELLAKEMYNYRLKVYLKCEDRSSMWHSVESRTPFSDDKELIEYVFSLPPCMKIRNGVNKYLLRESVKGLIPEKIRLRTDKKGFGTPNNRWISEIKDQLKDIFMEQDEYLNVPLLLKEYDDFFSASSHPNNNRVFRFMSFAQWRQVFGV